MPPESQIAKSYSQEDIQQILNLAISRQAYEGEFTRKQLLEIAEELEISPDCLQAAERDWSSQQIEIQKRQAFNQHRRSKLKKQAGKYVIINSFLLSLNWLSAGDLSWSPYILLIWGLGLGLNAWSTFQSQGEEYERAFSKWYRRHQVKRSLNTFFNKLLKA